MLFGSSIKSSALLLLLLISVFGLTFPKTAWSQTCGACACTWYGYYWEPCDAATPQTDAPPGMTVLQYYQMNGCWWTCFEVGTTQYPLMTDTGPAWLEATQNLIENQWEDIAKSLSQISGAVNSGRAAQTQVMSDVNTKFNQSIVNSWDKIPPYLQKGKNARQATVIRNTLACAQTLSDQIAARVQATSTDIVRLLVKAQGMTGAIVGANATSPDFIAGEVDDLCKLGFLDSRLTGRYGSVPSKMGCTDLSKSSDPALLKYIDADMDIGSVIDKLQYPLPTALLRKTGQFTFIGASTVDSGAASASDHTGLGSEMDFVAAYKFCEHIMPKPSAPMYTSNGQPTISNMASIRSDREQVSLQSAAANECFRAISYRLSCPSKSAAGGSGNPPLANADGTPLDCVNDQKALCTRLTNSFKAGGFNFTFAKSYPVLESALLHCQDAGLSRAMYDAIMAHRCHDDNYVQNLNSTMGGNATKVEDVVQTQCVRLEQNYEKRMERERQRLARAIRMVTQLSEGR